MNISLAVLDTIISIMIFLMVLKIYLMYGRNYIIWFLFGIFFMPVIFIYSIFEVYFSFSYAPIAYPIFVILIEISIIVAERKLLSSIRAEEGEEYKILLREDVALLKAFERIANYLIGRISPLIGIKNIEETIEECIEKYPLLAEIYINPNEKLITYAVEKNMEEIMEKERCKKLSQSFTFFIEKLIDLYAAFVPYDKIGEDINKIFSRIDNRKIIKWLIPFIILKTVIEPILRKCKLDELTEIRISIVIEGINLNKKGGIELHNIYEYEYEEIIEKIIKFFSRLHYILRRLFGDEINKEITKNFRSLPDNIKEEIYRIGIIKDLPTGILEEEKLTLMSREKLIEELIERKRKLEEAYRRLSEAKLDRMKANFINIIAHELRTPLTIIKTYTDLLLHEKLGKLNKLQKEKVANIAKNIEKLNDLINDMLQIPSINRQELEIRKENFYIKDAIKNVINDLKDMANEKKQKIKLSLNNSIVNGDMKLIEKALKNIISNAIKYTDENGVIEIKAKNEGDFAHIQIKDNGKGIKKGDVEKIFEPFYTGDGGGVGLGLAIAKNIIERHDGKIWAESEYGKGSTFHVILKRAK